MDSMAMPQPRQEKKKDFLKRSSRMKKGGNEKIQNIVKPIIYCVVVGTLAASVLRTF
jgi:hypothetical protein